MENYLAKRRKELGLTMKQVAEYVGVSEGTVSRWESGAIANMRRDRIKDLATILQTSPNFIMTGEKDVPMERGDPPATNIFPLPKTKKVPLLGTIACGTPILAVENVNEYVDMDSSLHADFALRCKGDSMINARVFDGDIVYIRQQPTVENGEIAAVMIGRTETEATLKRVFLDSEKIRLCAENPRYKDLVFFEEQMNEIRILGKAVAFLSNIS